MPRKNKGVPYNNRKKLDRYLEAHGLLDYQTRGMSQQEVAARYQQANVNVRPDWFSQHYGDRPAAPQTQVLEPPKPIQYKGRENQPYQAPGFNYSQTPDGLLIHQRGTLPPGPTTQQLREAGIFTVADAVKGTAPWLSVDVEQRKSLLSDPAFYQQNKIASYPTMVQQQMLADPAFRWDQLPPWQKAYYSFSSQPALMGAAQGLVMGLGNPGGAVLGAGIGWLSAKSGYDPTKEPWQQTNRTAGGIGWLNYLAERAEMGLGAYTQASQDIAAGKPVGQAVSQALSPEGRQAGIVWGEVMAPAYVAALRNRMVGEEVELKDFLNMARQAAILPEAMNLVGMAFMDAFMYPEKFKGEQIYLGAVGPVKVEQSFVERMDEARNRIKAGENYRQVMMDFQASVTAQMGDLAAQAAADPLNFVSGAGKATGKGLADVTGHKVASTALETQGGLLDAARMYKNLVQTGQAQTIDPAFRVDQMGALSRMIAGVNRKGQIKAGPFTRQGLLDVPKPRRNMLGWFEQMTTLDPASRAQVGAGLFYENIGAMLTMFETPREAGKYLRALAENDMNTWAELGTRFANSPEFYTVLPALRDFNASALDEIMHAWDASTTNRDALLRMADLLGTEPAKLLDDLSSRDTIPQDFVRIVEKIGKSNSPAAKAMMAEIQAGRFTPETLANIVDVFTGDGAIPWHPGQWKASMLDALGKHFDDWAVRHFGLKADSGFFRVAHLLKAAQSVLLLGGSPGYAITNGLSNMVHRAATGVFGFVTPKQTADWLARFGVKPSRIEEGYGIGAMVDQATHRTDVRNEAIRESKRGRGYIQSAQDLINAVGRRMPFTKLSGWFERQEGRQAYTIAMKQFWNQSWRRGVGFSKMRPELVQTLGEIGVPADAIYGAIEAGMNQADIERALFGRWEGLQSRSMVHEAAQSLGLSASDAADMLDKLGVLDALDGYLTGATTRDRVAVAFRRAAKRAQDEIDIAAQRDAIARAEHVSQRVGIEGAKALTDIITDVEMQGIEKWLQHYERMGEAAATADGELDPGQRVISWEEAYEESQQEYRRFNAMRGSTYLGIVKAIGLEQNPNARAWLAALADIDRTMDKAYQFMRDQRNGHFDKWRDDWTNPAQYDERANVEAKIDREFRRAMKQEDIHLSKMGDLLGQQYETLFGAPAGEAARQAWSTIVKFRKEMVSRQQKFRARQKDAMAQGVPAEERRAAARAFWQEEYKFMIIEMAKIKQDAIANLDNIARGKPPTAGPTPPEPAGPAGPAFSVEDYERAQQAAADRSAAMRDRVKGLWDIAEQYSKLSPGDTTNYNRAIFQDGFALLGALKKAEYGGDPTIKDLADAAEKLDADQIKAILEKRQEVKEQTLQAEIAEREARLAEELAAIKDKPRGPAKPIGILQAIRNHGGIDISIKDVRRDVTGETSAKGWQPGIFSKTGARRWGIDQMARILAEEDLYPIRIDDPADPGGVNQLIELMRRANRGEQIYPTDYVRPDADIEADAVAHIEQMIAEGEEISPEAQAAIQQAAVESAAAMQAALTEWELRVKKAATDGDLSTLAELFGEIDQELYSIERTPGQDYAGWMSDLWDETSERVARDAEDLKIAENLVRAQTAIEEMQSIAEAAMTRSLLIEKYQEAFPNVKLDQIQDWMEISDAVLETIGKLTGKSKEEMYAFYQDVIRGTDPVDLMQIQPITRRMTRAEIDDYARALVRAGEESLRMAVQDEPRPADKIALLDAAHAINPALAEKVAGGVWQTLYQEAWHGSPYTFDRFDLTKIGEGEGAQAYGWGLYFADEKAVAEHYYEKLRDRFEPIEYKGQPARYTSVVNDPLYRVGQIVRAMEDSRRTAKEAIAEHVASYRENAQFFRENGRLGAAANYEQVADAYAALNPDDFKGGWVDTGKIYKVEIPDDNYLLWDRPIIEMSTHVQVVLRELGFHVPDMDSRDLAKIKKLRIQIEDEETRQANASRPDYRKYDRLVEQLEKLQGPTGKDIYYRLQGNLYGNETTGPRAASMALKKAGLNGIKYLDASSRARGEGAHNYVIFDDKAVKILATEERNLNLLKGTRLYQEAWHGSPHQFDRFTLEKIGAGEGAQVYGWGLYFTDTKAVAEYYREALTHDRAIFYLDGEQMPDHGYYTTIGEILDKLGYPKEESNYEWGNMTDRGAAHNVLFRLYDTGDWDIVREQITDSYKGQDRMSTVLREKNLLMLDTLRERIRIEHPTGQVFKVEIPDENYLLWDRPLTDQPKDLEHVLDDMVNRETDYHKASLLSRYFDNPDNLRKTGEEFYHELTELLGDPQSASMALDRVGISGIKYLDADSRGTGEGTYNYVIFDDEAIRILDTLYQSGGLGQPAKGGVDFINGKAIIHAWEGGDISTLVHENAHVFLQMMRDAGARTGNTKVLDDLATVDDWTRLEQNGNVWTAVNGKGNHTITQRGDSYFYRGPSGQSREFAEFAQAQYVLEQEMFARGFERYLAEGHAPTAALKRVFANFKRWLLDIYQAITGSAIDVNLTQEIREFFARMMGMEETAPVVDRPVTQPSGTITEMQLKPRRQAPTEEALSTIAPMDEWEINLPRTRDLAKQLIEAGIMPGDAAEALWADHQGLIGMVKRYYPGPAAPEPAVTPAAPPTPAVQTNPGEVIFSWSSNDGRLNVDFMPPTYDESGDLQPHVRINGEEINGQAELVQGDYSGFSSGVMSRYRELGYPETRQNPPVDVIEISSNDVGDRLTYRNQEPQTAQPEPAAMAETPPAAEQSLYDRTVEQLNNAREELQSATDPLMRNTWQNKIRALESTIESLADLGDITPEEAARVLPPPEPATPERDTIGKAFGWGKFQTRGNRVIEMPNTKKYKNPKKKIETVDRWLLREALAEADALGDDYNSNIFSKMVFGRLSPADRDLLNFYLFGVEDAFDLLTPAQKLQSGRDAVITPTEKAVADLETIVEESGAPAENVVIARPAPPEEAAPAVHEQIAELPKRVAWADAQPGDVVGISPAMYSGGWFITTLLKKGFTRKADAKAFAGANEGRVAIDGNKWAVTQDKLVDLVEPGTPTQSFNIGPVLVDIMPPVERDGVARPTWRINGREVVGAGELGVQFPQLYDAVVARTQELQLQAVRDETPAGTPETAIPAGEPETGPQIDMFADTSEDLPLFSGTAVSALEEVFSPQPEVKQESMFDLRPDFVGRVEDTLIKIKQGDPDPAAPEPAVPVTRERTLLNALTERLENDTFFAKSRDFETYIKNLGFNLEDEKDLNLAYDIMEGAYNIEARRLRKALDAVDAPLARRLEVMAGLEERLTEARRTLGKMALQQFSTPLTLSEAAGYAADVHPGDVVGEPTAGTANLVDRFHDTEGVQVVVNEIDPGRRQVLSLIGYDPTGLDLMAPEWIIQNGVKAGPWATVQITNPPWGSYSTGKYGKAMNVPVKLNDWSQRFTYLELMRLAEGGRMVGVMPTNWLYTLDRSTRETTVRYSEFYKWLKKNYTVQAVIESPPGAYKQRATDISSLLIVIDKTTPLMDVPTMEHFAGSQPKNWAEYAGLVERIPKRTQEAVTNAAEQLKHKPTGPDAAGIFDPNAAKGLASADIEHIGQPAPRTDEGTAGTGRARPGGEQPVTRSSAERDRVDAAEPAGEAGDTGPGLVEPEPAGVPAGDERFAYSAEFLDRLARSKATVRSSRSFAEYVGRAPLTQDDVTHPHPNTVVETKELTGVPYPPLEEAYRPSPSVMRAMKNRTLSLDGNIDPVWAAIQQNDKHHKGMLIADDVGMGKSRTGAAFVIDRIEKGHKRILVVTDKEQNVLNLMNSEFPQVYAGVANETGGYLTDVKDFPAQRIYLNGANFPEVKKGEKPIPTFDEPAVYFITSSQFMYFTEQIKQLAPTAIVIDEAHEFKNVGNTKRGQAWTELHEDWTRRNASMLYLTATPGTDIADLQYLYGLKIWAMDGFADWVNIITGVESVEKVKARNEARAEIDDWATRIDAARDAIPQEPATIKGSYGMEWNGIKVGEFGIFKETGKWARFGYEYKGRTSFTSAQSETEMVILADMVNKMLAERPAAAGEIGYYDLGRLWDDAQSMFIERFKPPGRDVIRNLSVKGITEASDILKQKDGGKWNRNKGLSAYEFTLPPAHTEQIMRELKIGGSYMSRDISRAGVEFDVKQYNPPAAAKAQHNRRIEFYRKLDEAFNRWGKANEGPAKTAAMYGISGDLQADAKRSLFNMRLPGVIAEADAAIARGEQVVISVVSVSEVTGEAGSLAAAIKKINTHEVHKEGKGEYSDPMDIPEALAEIADLRAELESLPKLPSPVDVLLEHYGDRLGFITGKVDVKERAKVASEFQKNRLDVVVISGAGKQGINLHDVTGKKRIHLITADYEWSATKFKQELGRVDRTGQRSSPFITVMHTGSAGETKFVSTISNRMKGLGATSKGGAESTGTGALTDEFELGTMTDRIALNAAWQEMPIQWKQQILDHRFRDPQVDDAVSTLDTTAETFGRFLKALQTIDMDTANEMMEFYMKKRAELAQTTSGAEDEARNTAANSGKILRQVDLGPNLRLTEVVNQDNHKFAVLDGVLTPHMNKVKTIITTQGTVEALGNAWMRWTRFFDEEKNQYVTGLIIPPTKIKAVAERFGQALGSGHTKENALVDLNAGDRIKLHGANAAEWELYLGRGGSREGKIVIDYARMKDREVLGNNGASYNALGNFFFVTEENLPKFLDRFPIRNDEPEPPRLYQDYKPSGQKLADGSPILEEADPNVPMGGFEQAASWLPESEVRDQGWTEHVQPLLKEMHKVARRQLNNKKLAGASRDLSPEGAAMLRQYMQQVQGEMATSKLATVRWGENQRDHAMFNYNRRYGWDKMMDVVYPYQFFYGRAMMRWLQQAVDKPYWFSNYARLKRQQQRYENDMPERLRNKIRIPAPWMPDWMGDSLYIDPIANLFPPAQFLRPFERAQQDQSYQMIEAERILQEWSEDGSVPANDIQQAALTRQGPTWERAFSEAQMRREAEMSGPMDFFASMFGPAWYLSTPLNLAGIKVPGISKGEPEKVSTLPLTNTARAMQAATQGTWAEPVGKVIGLLGKPEEWARKKLELPTLGEYGEYYTKRQVANMVADGKITAEQAEQAMIEKAGPIWEEATQRVNLELAMRVPLAGTVYAATHGGAGQAAQAFLPSLFGSGLLPAGELEYRGLKQEWNQAWKEYDAGDKQAVTEFFNEHPEYQAYLAKGKEDGDLLRDFLVGQVWDRYMALTDTNRKAARSQMGDLFEQAFLDKETRSYESIDVETLARWSQMLGGLVPSTKETMPAIEQPAPKLDLYGKDVTRITDQFFQDRTRLYPNYYKQEQEYYNLPKPQRRAYLLANPQLKAYWDWKKKWYDTYPGLQPVFSGKVFKTVDTSAWPPALVQYVSVYAMTGQKLPRGAAAALNQIWIREGKPYDDLETWLNSQVVPAMMYQSPGAPQ